MGVRYFRWKKALTLLILWKPYMFSCLTKLENCPTFIGQVGVRSQELMRIEYASQSSRLRYCV
jgi:hypothetical protein